MADSTCADCYGKVKNGTMCTCRRGISLSLQSNHLRTLWLGIKIGMVLGTKVKLVGEYHAPVECNDKKCKLYVAGGVHKKGTTLCTA